MDVALWIIAGLLAASFLGAGVVKLVQPRDKLRAAGMEWIDDFSDPAVHAIAAAEVLAAVGLVVPPLLGFATWLVPAAAGGLVLLMAGAIVVHLRRGETNNATTCGSLLVLAGFVAVARVVVPV